VPPASASVAFLDRPAGLSRDPSEPEASLSSFRRRKGPAREREEEGHGGPRGRRGPPDQALSIARVRGERARGRDDQRRAPSGAAIQARSRTPRSLKRRAAFTLGDPRAPSPHREARRPARARRRPQERHPEAPREGRAVREGRDRPQGAAVPVTPPPRWATARSRSTRAVICSSARTTASRGSIGRASPRPRGRGRVARPSSWPGSFALTRVEQRCDSPHPHRDLRQRLRATPPRPAWSRRSRSSRPSPRAGSPGYGRCTPIASVPVTPRRGGCLSSGSWSGIGPDLVAVQEAALKRPSSRSRSSPSRRLSTWDQCCGAARSPDGATITVPTSRGLLVAPAGGAANYGPARKSNRPRRAPPRLEVPAWRAWAGAPP
jgi:hypothetical protein